MMYLYGMVLVIIMVALISGCITNNAYTQTGEGHKVHVDSSKDLKSEKITDKKTDTRLNSQIDTEISGVKKGDTNKSTINKTDMK